MYYSLVYQNYSYIGLFSDDLFIYHYYIEL